MQPIIFIRLNIGDLTHKNKDHGEILILTMDSLLLLQCVSLRKICFFLFVFGLLPFKENRVFLSEVAGSCGTHQLAGRWAIPTSTTTSRRRRGRRRQASSTTTSSSRMLPWSRRRFRRRSSESRG